MPARHAANGPAGTVCSQRSPARASPIQPAGFWMPACMRRPGSSPPVSPAPAAKTPEDNSLAVRSCRVHRTWRAGGTASSPASRRASRAPCSGQGAPPPAETPSRDFAASSRRQACFQACVTPRTSFSSSPQPASPHGVPATAFSAACYGVLRSLVEPCFGR